MRSVGSCIIVISLFFSVSSCDLFSPRKSEIPTRISSSFQPPITPEIVVQNFKTAIREHNVDNYMRCFIDTMVSSKNFIFTPSSNLQSIIVNWNLDDERKYFQNLGEPVLGVSYLDLYDSTKEFISSNVTGLKMKYFLDYPHQYDILPKNARGYMQLYLEMDTKQRWAIYKWDDLKTDTDSTWSFLKYRFAY